MQKRLSAEKTDVANTSSMKNLERGIKALSIQPSEIVAGDPAIGKIAEVAECIAGISDRDIAKGGTAVANKAQHVPYLGSSVEHARR